MARNQRKQHLDKPTRDHLSALDDYINKLAEEKKPKQPGEFTLAEFVEKMAEKGVEMSQGQAREHLDQLTAKKVVSKRLIPFKGGNHKVFKFL